MPYHIQVARPSRASAETRAVFEQISSIFPGPVPDPFRIYSETPELLRAVWRQTTDAYFHSVHLPRRYKDVVAGAVSQANDCPLCVVAHSELVRTADRRVARAILGRDPKLASDPLATALIAWGLASRNPSAPVVRRPKFPASMLPEAIAVAVAFNVANRMVNVFLPPNPFPGPVALRPVFAFLGRSAMRRIGALELPVRGRSDYGRLPEDLRWADPVPAVAGVMDDLSRAADRAGAAAVSPAVRACLEDHVGRWEGEAPPLGRGWTEAAVSHLEREDRALGELLLMVALTSERVTGITVAAARASLEGDAALVRACFWASFLAARRVGSWLAPGRPGTRSELARKGLPAEA